MSTPDYQQSLDAALSKLEGPVESQPEHAQPEQTRARPWGLGLGLGLGLANRTPRLGPGPSL